ncbi:MAG: Gfo/Idh/MocA family protein [Acidimicrobiales bacterium]
MATVLRWGIIGTGRIAHTFATDLALAGAGEVVAVGSRTLGAATAFGEEFGVERRFGSYEELVADPGVDVVYVSTPHPFHHANTRLALEHDKPVLVEKAFTMTGAQARDLVALARSRRRFLMEAMWTRCLPHVVALRDVLASGVLGDVVALYADHGQWFARDATSRLFAPELGGGALLDLGVYPVSFASMVLGAPQRITALVDPCFTGVDGQASMLFGYASGAQAVLTCTSGARSATRASVIGSEARVEVAGSFYAPTSFAVISRDGQVTEYGFETTGRGLHYQASEVARCLGAGELESPAMPLDETVQIMETMEKVLAFL